MLQYVLCLPGQSLCFRVRGKFWGDAGGFSLFPLLECINEWCRWEQEQEWCVYYKWMAGTHHNNRAKCRGALVTQLILSFHFLKAEKQDSKLSNPNNILHLRWTKQGNDWQILGLHKLCWKEKVFIYRHRRVWRSQSSRIPPRGPNCCVSSRHHPLKKIIHWNVLHQTCPDRICTFWPQQRAF